MSLQVYFEVPIVLLSLCCWITKLSQVYAQYIADVELEPSMLFFMLQLLLSTMWIICATITMQWLVLITTCNGFLCQLCIIFFMFKTRQRDHEKALSGYIHVAKDDGAGGYYMQSSRKGTSVMVPVVPADYTNLRPPTVIGDH